MAKFEGDKNLSLKPSQSKVRSVPFIDLRLWKNLNIKIA